MTIFIFYQQAQKHVELTENENNWVCSYLTYSMDSKVSFDPEVREVPIPRLKQVRSNQNPNVHVHRQKLLAKIDSETYVGTNYTLNYHNQYF